MGNNNNKQKNKLNEQAQLQHVIILTKKYDLINSKYNIFIKTISNITTTFKKSGFKINLTDFKKNWKNKLLGNLTQNNSIEQNKEIIDSYIDTNIKFDKENKDYYRINFEINRIVSDFKQDLLTIVGDLNNINEYEHLKKYNEEIYLEYLVKLRDYCVRYNFLSLLIMNFHYICEFIKIWYPSFYLKNNYVKSHNESLNNYYYKEIRKITTVNTDIDDLTMYNINDEYITIISIIVKKYLNNKNDSEKYNIENKINNNIDDIIKKHIVNIIKNHVDESFENIINYINNNKICLYNFYLKNYIYWCNYEFFNDLKDIIITIRDKVCSILKSNSVDNLTELFDFNIEHTLYNLKLLRYNINSIFNLIIFNITKDDFENNKNPILSNEGPSLSNEAIQKLKNIEEIFRPFEDYFKLPYN